MDTKKVMDVTLASVETSDYPDFSNAYIDSAWYENENGEIVEMNDKELDELNDDRDFVYDQVMDFLF